jgi:betaine-aldehyde dehydrogenase
VIDGEEGKSSSGKQFTRENPADHRQVVTAAEEGTAADVRTAIEAARRAFDGNRENWVNNYKLRERVLFRTAELLRADAQRLASIVSLEVGMPMRQAAVHVAAAADVFDFYAGYAGKLYGESFFLPSGSMINLVKEPIGVVGLITPWNFPLTQTARKVAPALAAGCTVVLKPASYTPASAYEMVKLLQRAGVPKGVVNFVPGPGSVVGMEMVRSPGVDKLSFTGETGTGKRIAAEAARDVKRISLELGGKAPYVVFDDADQDAASRAAIFGRFRNAGQACGATTRLLIQEGIHDSFMERVVELAKKIQVGNPASQSTDMGPMISRSQEATVLEYIKFGIDAGFDLALGGNKLDGGEYRHGYYVEPTIFDNVDNSSRLGQEEIFGPVVVATPFKDEEEAVRLANDVPFGLVAGVWSNDYVRSMRVARRIRAGTVWIWDNYAQPAEGIWGGFKQSGIGRELGPYGLDDFVEIKQIFTDGTGMAMKPAYRQVIKE